MNETVTEQELHAYLDGQLNDARRRQVEAWLEAHPAERTRLQEYRAIDAELGQAFDAALREPVPAHLEALLADHPISPAPWRRAALVAGVALLGGVAGWWLKAVSLPPQAPQVATLQSGLVGPARVSYRVYTPEVLHPVEVTRDQEPHLVKWLSKRLGAEIKAPALDPLGFSLVGGRLLPGEQGPAALFMYESSTGQRLTLYVRRRTVDTGQTGFQYQESDGLASFYWIESPLGYVLTAPLPRDRLLKLARSVYHQLSL